MSFINGLMRKNPVNTGSGPAGHKEADPGVCFIERSLPKESTAAFKMVSIALKCAKCEP